MFIPQIDGEAVSGTEIYRGEPGSVRIVGPQEDGGGPLAECEACGWEGDAYDAGYEDGADRCPECGEPVTPPTPNPEDWLNSAGVRVDPEDNAIHLHASIGDPRGAFVLTLRRLPKMAGGEPNPRGGRLVMHVPHTGDTLLHERLTPLHAGTYGVGHGWTADAEARCEELSQQRQLLDRAARFIRDAESYGAKTLRQKTADQLFEMAADIDRERHAVAVAAQIREDV